jgi:hypothetical protein
MNTAIKEIYFTEDRIEKFNFFQIPKVLMNKKYDGLRIESKFLYGLCLERTKLSKTSKNKSKWIDKEGRVFIYFERREVADMLGIGEKKAGSLFKELEKFGLIHQVSQTRGTAIRIYVLKTPLKEAVEKRDYKKSKKVRDEKNKILEFKTTNIENQKDEKVENHKHNDNGQKGSSPPVKNAVGHQSKRPNSNKEKSNKEYKNNNNREIPYYVKLLNKEKNKKDVVVENDNNLNFIDEAKDENIKVLQNKWINTLEVYLDKGFTKDTLIVNKDTMKELIKEHGIEKINRYLDNHECFTPKKTPTGLLIKAIKNNYQITKVKPIAYATNSWQPVQATNFEQREYPDEFFESVYENF